MPKAGELVDDIPVGKIFINDRDYNTLGGFVMDRLQKVPRSGDHFTYKGFSFEVVDMDGHRVDKVIITNVEAEKE